MEPFVQTLRRLCVLSLRRRGEESSASTTLQKCKEVEVPRGLGGASGDTVHETEGGGGAFFPDMLLCASHRTERIEDLFHESSP